MLPDSGSDPYRWTLRRILNRSAEVFREEGFRSVLFRILGETFYRRVILLEHSLDVPIVPATTRIPLEVRMPVRTESQEYLDFRPDTRAATVRRRLEAGHWYVTGHYEGRLVYVRWVGVGNSYEYYLDCNFNMDPKDAYLYDLFVASRFRGQNIATAVGSQVYQYLQVAGYRRTVTSTIPESKAALRVSEKSGDRVIGKAGYYRLGTWKKLFCRTAPGKLALKLSPANLAPES